MYDVLECKEYPQVVMITVSSVIKKKIIEKNNDNVTMIVPIVINIV